MSLTMKEKWERRIIPFLMETLGGILVAVALDSFAVNAEFPLTGFSGIALIFNRLFGLPLGATIVAWCSISRWHCCAISCWERDFSSVLSAV